jgi:hypothetical protein
MTETGKELSELTMHIHQEIEINAPLETVFKSVLDQMGSKAEYADGTPMPLVLEAWPGGRLFRDTGKNAGHLWGHVQVIKPPTLLEICGPLMMSFPAINHVSYRLKEQPGSTLLIFDHRGLGNIPQQMRDGMHKGWGHFLEMIKKHSLK